MAEQCDSPVMALIPTKASPNDFHITAKLRNFFESNLFHALLTILILLDLFIVLLEIILLLLYCDDIPHHIHAATQDLVYVSIGILGLFLVELSLHVYAYGAKVWCCHCLHVFDFVVVLTTLIAEVVFVLIKDEKIESLVGLLIVFRLWRLVRVIHVTTEALENSAEMKMLRLEKEITNLVERLKQIPALKERLSRYESVDDEMTGDEPNIQLSSPCSPKMKTDNFI